MKIFITIAILMTFVGLQQSIFFNPFTEALQNPNSYGKELHYQQFATIQKVLYHLLMLGLGIFIFKLIINFKKDTFIEFENAKNLQIISVIIILLGITEFLSEIFKYHTLPELMANANNLNIEILSNYLIGSAPTYLVYSFLVYTLSKTIKYAIIEKNKNESII